MPTTPQPIYWASVASVAPGPPRPLPRSQGRRPRDEARHAACLRGSAAPQATAFGPASPCSGV